MKKSFYVIFSPPSIKGIYNTWLECKSRLDSVGGKKDYMGVATIAQANFARDNCNNVKEYKEKSKRALWTSPEFLMCFPARFLTVDAAFSSATGVMEYRGVICPSLEQVFHGGPYSSGGTNNIGEFLAIVDGFRYMEQVGPGEIMAIYSDSRIAITWIRNGGLCRTNAVVPVASKIGVALSRAERWLANHAEFVAGLRLEKWDTSKFGEIPADFDRK